MASSMDILAPGLGIQSVLDTQVRETLPQALPLASGASSETRLEELFSGGNMWTMTERMLRPDVGDGAMLVPSVFSGTLRSCMDALAADESPQARQLVTEEIEPLLQNNELLQAYVGLLIGG